MATLAEVIRTATERGVVFRIRGNRLRVTFPAGERTPQLEEWIASRKDRIVAYFVRSLRAQLKHEGLSRFAELIEAAQAGRLPKQDAFVVIYENAVTGRRIHCANLTNWVLHHAHYYEHRERLGYRTDSEGRRICHQQRLLNLELARRWYEAQKGHEQV